MVQTLSQVFNFSADSKPFANHFNLDINLR